MPATLTIVDETVGGERHDALTFEWPSEQITVRELIRERARVGRDAAQKRGVRFGRPPKLNTIQRALADRLLSEGQSAKQVAKVFGVHVSTIYRFVGTYSA